jgi:hypothetical protein
MAKITWTNTAGGDFANGANWSTGTVPGASDDALLTAPGAYTVTSSQNETVNSLQMISTVIFDVTGGTFDMVSGSGSGTDAGLINVGGGDTLEMGGTLAGTGTVALNTNGYNTDLLINAATVTLSGGGTVALSDGAQNRILAATGGDILNNLSDTISGSGQIGVGSMGLTNQSGGVIDATGTVNQLVINLAGYTATNAGLIEATGSAGLVLLNSALTQSGSGTVKAVGAGRSVFLNNSSITGGTLATTGGGLIQSSNLSTLSSLTIAAGSTVGAFNGTTLDLLNTITNKGTLELGTNGYNTDLIAATPTVTLTGGGTVLMNDGFQNRIFGATSTTKLVNVNNKISGSGQIGLLNGAQLVLVNEAAGTIDATGTANGLTLDLNAFTNAGLVEATGTAGLGIDATTVSNSGTLLANGAGTTVNLYNGTDILGGQLQSRNGGLIETSNYATLDGSTIGGAVTITAGSQMAVANGTTLSVLGTIDNLGTISLAGNGYNDDLVIASATVTLTGGGHVVLSDIGTNRIYGTSSANLLVNVNNTISGSGQFGTNQGSFVNQAAGTIDATGTNAGLTIIAQSFVNQGLLEDTGLAGLGIDATTIQNSATVASFGAGANVNLYNGSDIIGGLLASSGGGVFETTNFATIDGATSGAITLGAGAVFDVLGGTTLSVDGTLVNDGIVALLANGYNTDLVFNTATVTLTGGGTIALDDVGTNRIYGATSTDTLVNVNNLITGSGQIGVNQGTFINESAGVIDATGTAAGLTILATGFTNQGLIEDTGPAGLGIDATIVLNQGTIGAFGAGTNVNLYNGAVIQGGLLAASQGGDLFVSNYAYLDGTTNGAITIAAGTPLNIENGTTLYAMGSIVNKGTIALGGNGYNTDLVANGPTLTLTGGGMVLLSDTGSNRLYSGSSADTLVNNNDTIIGSGQIGASQGTIDNQAGGVINSNGTAGMTLAATAFSNQGLIEATGSGGIGIGATTIVNSGVIGAFGGTVNFFNGAVLQGGTLEASNGGTLETTNYAYFDGATNGVIEIAAGATFNIVNGATLFASGTIANAGTILLSGNGYNTDLAVDGPTLALSGGGSVVLANSNNARIYGISASDKLINVSDTISGGGQFGFGQLTLDNQAHGTIDANDAIALTISLGSSFTNEGLVEATGAGGVVIQNATLTNTGTIEAGTGSALTIASSTSLTNFSAGTLTGGAWEALAGSSTAVLSAPTGPVTTDAATIVLSGAGASITFGGTAIAAALTTVTTTGALEILAGASFVATNTLTDDGKITLGGALTESAISIAKKATLTALGAGTVTTTGKLTNAGTLEAGTNATLVLAGGTLTNSGTVLAEAGGKVVASAKERDANLATGTLSGVWDATGANASIALESGTVSALSGTVILSTAGSELYSGGTGKIALESSLSTIAGTGTLEILSGRNFASTSAGLADSGTILLGGGTFSATALSVAGSFSGAGSIADALSLTGTLASVVEGTATALTITGAITGTGTVSAGAGTSLTASGGLTAATASVAATGTLTAGSLTTSGAVSDSGALVLTGGTLAAASLTIAAAAQFSGTGTVAPQVQNQGTITATAGTLALAGGETGGSLAAATGGTLAASAAVNAASLAIAAGADFSGFGTIATTADAGTLTAQGGNLTLAALGGAGSAVIAAGATLTSTAALTLTGGLTFAAGTDTLALGTPNGDTTTLAGFGAGSTIDLLNTTATSFAYNASTGLLTLRDGTKPIGQLKLAGTYSQASFQLTSDGHSGTDIVFTGTDAAAVPPAPAPHIFYGSATGHAPTVADLFTMHLAHAG